MKACNFSTLVILSWLLLTSGFSSSAAVPERREWKVGDQKREALVAAPESAKTKPTPVIFAFHGHGGSMHNAERTFAYETHWPEAIVVYMQGLNTPGRLVDPEGKRAGWQMRAGEQDDRDLKFFDEVLATLKKEFKVDEKRIYATGHSNGGGFTYLLWAERGDTFAAVAPCAAAAGLPMLRNFKPKPVFHLAGEKDPLVKYSWQKATIDAVKKVNQCGEGKPWHSDAHCTIYESKAGAPLVTYIHDGGHAFPREAADVIVAFFKEHAKN